MEDGKHGRNGPTVRFHVDLPPHLLRSRDLATAPESLPPIHRIHFQATWMPQDCGARATVPNWIGTRFLNLFLLMRKELFHVQEATHRLEHGSCRSHA